ncbi:hydantoinase B/oxoprolinase family protein [Phytohabitans sp. ZYX-F-186]|uniref:Hydantoinase B/oxoprolinase family protein n=1 Tax=Phytohabitans maris TaxID=3071409 RepID=A0ABU0ZSW3_9ACTN|nr:hydantoinase B/oxoprolinase family protein [Phytohabitans sp. ZYX-F-186]MDQ7910123.1 hydantoinase B/oxoprolinase family protein [Phytohabitans sp. ZYX-F-186]
MTAGAELDATTLAVLRAALQQVATEMDTTLVRSAFSPVISEMDDRASGLYDAADGATIAQGPESMPIFVSGMGYAVGHTVRLLREGGRMSELRDGDVYIVNDPYAGGTHAPDVKLIAPYFVDGDLFCWLATSGHWLDVGGSLPGSVVPDATECYAEGLRIPPVLLYRAGKACPDVAALIFENIRSPRQQQADLEAMLNALRVGRRRLDVLVARFGAATITAAVTELRARAAGRMREIIAGLPDGEYTFEDHLDDDGAGGGPMLLRLALRIAGDTMTFDFTGSAPPARGPMNLGRDTTAAAAFIAIKHMFPDVPVNGGALEPITFVVGDHTFLNASRPAPVGGYLDCASRVITVVLGALGTCVPDRVPADWFGTSAVMSLAAVGRDGRPVAIPLPAAGGMGALPDDDGLVNAPPPHGTAKYPSVEMMERRFPVRFERIELTPDSAGDGQFRGGLGNTYQITSLDPSVSISLIGDRARFAPFGVYGGTAARTLTVHLDVAGRRERVDGGKVRHVRLGPGDAVTLCSPGGGGWGDPRRRHPAAIAADLGDGYITSARTRAVYDRRDPSDEG